MRAKDIESRVGKNHLQAIKVRDQMADLREAIVNEQRRISSSFGKDYELARARYDELSAAVTGRGGWSSDTQARIRELESTADTLRIQYNRMLQQLSEMNNVEAQPSIGSDALVLMRAAPPTQTEASKKRWLDPGWRVVYGLAAGRFRCPGKEFPVRCVQNVAAGDPRDGSVLCCLAGYREC